MEEAAEKEEAEQGDIMNLVGALDQPLMLHRSHNLVNAARGNGYNMRLDDQSNNQHFVSGDLDHLGMIPSDVTKISHKGVETV